MSKTQQPVGTVLVVDDVVENVQVLSRLLVRDGHRVHSASNGREALESVPRIQPDLILMDVMMPVMSGLEACRRLKSHEETRLIPVVLVTALDERGDKIQGINAGADDFLTKPVDQQELSARVRSFVRLRRFTTDLDSAESVIMSLALTIEARDASTEGHCHRLARSATALGVHLDLVDEDLSALHRGGFLHDVGKVGVPDAVLLKPGPLTKEEFEQMKQHTLIGDRLCGELRSLKSVRPIVRSHHERLDGSGYPDGLRGNEIPLLAQIIGIVDVFDALTNARPYKPALSVEDAYQELDREVRKGWRRRDLVAEFIVIAKSGRLQRLMADTRTIQKTSV
jgi:putative two-component system response regulator